jgi:hypothetical protein
MRVRLLFLLAVAATAACGEDRSCTALGIVRETSYTAELPASLDPASVTIEVCFGTTCDTARLMRSANPNVVGLRCEDIDGRTPTFPTQCELAESDRKLVFTTNTVYGGHAGSDPLVVTAIGTGGERTEILRGTVAYENTTDEAARGACTDAWSGTFTKG